MFTLGMKVIWLRTSIVDSTVQEIASGTITKIGKCYGEDCVWVDNQHRGEDALYTPYAWPNQDDTRLLLNTSLLMAARHKEEEAALFKTTLDLRNKLVRKSWEKTITFDPTDK